MAVAWARLMLLSAAALLMGAAPPPEGGAARVFAASLASPPLLRAFLFRMPKGGDLHQHVSGAAYAEDLIRLGAAHGLCVADKTALASPPPCAGADVHPLADALTDSALYTRLVDAWSLRAFTETSGDSSHDHFFNAFALFGAATELAPLVAESADRAGHQRLQYLELMATFQGGAVRALAGKIPWTGDFDAARKALIAQGLADIVAKARGRRALLHCDTPQASDGCGVTVRYIEQVTRTAPPAQVFAQTLFGFLLTQSDPDVVGINFVAPEDDVAALDNYTLHMRMLDYLHGLMPHVGIALHAGELTLGLVPPRDLAFHIRQAVELGHAARIGHGVDILYEDDPFDLLREMARRRIAVEINLTSNAAILHVTGADHPFPIYMRAQVPTVISTDDEGIERTDLTNELQIAVTTYKLSYATLVGLQRNSLEFAFIGGASLWADPHRWLPVKACAGTPGRERPAAACAAFLHGSEKAQLQWQLEQQLRLFDTEAASLRMP
jgi:hypothetical protein